MGKKIITNITLKIFGELDIGQGHKTDIIGSPCKKTCFGYQQIIKAQTPLHVGAV